MRLPLICGCAELPHLSLHKRGGHQISTCHCCDNLLGKKIQNSAGNNLRGEQFVCHILLEPCLFPQVPDEHDHENPNSQGHPQHILQPDSSVKDLALCITVPQGEHALTSKNPK